jgi:hypothetical protein
LLLGRGDGTFRLASQVTLQLPPGDRTDALTLADLDRDGRLDVVLRSGQIWRGDGAGGVAASPVNAGVQAGALADVNADGYLDIVSFNGSYGNNGVRVSLGRGMSFAPPILSPTPDLGGDAFSIGDLNADGRLDVVVSSGHLMLGNGDGTFVFGGRFNFGAPSYSTADNVLVADLSGDGLPDILTSFRPGQVSVLTNRRTSVNTPPTVDAGPDRTIEFADIAGEDCGAIIIAAGADADAHYLSFEWRDQAGEIVSESDIVRVCIQTPGQRVFTVTVRDGRGGVATDTVTVTRVLTKEIVLWAADVDDIQGQWSRVADPTAAGGVRLHDQSLGAAKVSVPLADPPSRVVVRFYPEPSLAYKLWIRLKADGNSWANDSVWVQFSGAIDASGTPKYQMFSNSGLAINLEECSGCGESGWGWEDDGWGARNVNGVMLRFPNPDWDPQSMVIQTREDGVSIDQIVLSAEKYLTTRPGAVKNDATILPSTRPRR